MKVKPVIMAGGSGTRLWPLSRRLYPKQFIKIFDDLSLLQKTLIRNKSFGKPIVIVCEEHKFIAAQQIMK
jgi:mannose-1-phosphate guanylyltransferase